ncbi:MAG TPA: hypothetical protein VJM74_03905 [Nitrososphaeraceae archaeon]|nr:hypothetical protein [Nitrososphaeraceae archaeon]
MERINSKTTFINRSNGTTSLSEAQIKMWSQSDNTQRKRLVGILEELIKQAEMEMVHT